MGIIYMIHLIIVLKLAMPLSGFALHVSLFGCHVLQVPTHLNAAAAAS